MGWLLSFTEKTTDLLKLFIFYSTYKCAGQCSEWWHRSRHMRGKNVLFFNGMTWESGPLCFVILSHTWCWASSAATGCDGVPTEYQDCHIQCFIIWAIIWVLLASLLLRCGNIFLKKRNEFDPRCISGVEETHAPAREHRALRNWIRELACRSFTFLSWNFSHWHNEAVELAAALFVS